MIKARNKDASRVKAAAEGEEERAEAKEEEEGQRCRGCLNRASMQPANFKLRRASATCIGGR